MSNEFGEHKWQRKQEQMRSMQGQLEIYEKARERHLRKLAWLDKRIRKVSMEVRERHES